MTVYTTPELIAILDEELKANWRGERLLPSSGDRLNNPVIAKALGVEKLSKLFAYQDFRAQIHTYQRQHRVSGIVWKTCRVGETTLDLPEIHNQLVAIEGDKATLMQAKAQIMEVWDRVTRDMQLWLSRPDPEALSVAQFQGLLHQAEWLELDVARSEFYLGICWGDPAEYRYRWAQPDSGCERVIAAISEPSATKV